eukprot:1329056-Rhodomonas_salina.1
MHHAPLKLSQLWPCSPSTQNSSILSTYVPQVHLGYDFRASRSRAGVREQGGGKPKKSKKPDPEAVLRFLRGLTTDQVLQDVELELTQYGDGPQVLRNRVALALKAGPGAIRKLYQLFDKDGNNEIDE